MALALAFFLALPLIILLLLALALTIFFLLALACIVLLPLLRLFLLALLGAFLLALHVALLVFLLLALGTLLGDFLLLALLLGGFLLGLAGLCGFTLFLRLPLLRLLVLLAIDRFLRRFILVRLPLHFVAAKEIAQPEMVAERLQVVHDVLQCDGRIGRALRHACRQRCVRCFIGSRKRLWAFYWRSGIAVLNYHLRYRRDYVAES